MKKVMFISSTGGHLTELLQLKPLFEKCEYTIVTEKTKYNLNDNTGYRGINIEEFNKEVEELLKRVK